MQHNYLLDNEHWIIKISLLEALISTIIYSSVLQRVVSSLNAFCFAGLYESCKILITVITHNLLAFKKHCNYNINIVQIKWYPNVAISNSTSSKSEDKLKLFRGVFWKLYIKIETFHAILFIKDAVKEHQQWFLTTDRIP